MSNHLKTLLNPLIVTAGILGLVHTLAGPERYLPFVGVAQARHWSRFKALRITAGCAVGQIGGSLALGLLGYGAGASLGMFGLTLAGRINIAAALLIGCGLVSAIWRLRRAGQEHSHGHVHSHGGSWHAHDHIHDPKSGRTIYLTPSTLFALLTFSPCISVVLLFVYPGAKGELNSALALGAAYASTTLIAMIGAVAAALRGGQNLPLQNWGRYGPVVTGGILAVTGCAMLRAGS